ncbi:MAG: HAD hydrolase-like protein [Acidobacteriaceae bacterium]|nr:HAD hydrolase-like protein [Acidobacteriaceae bacterium]MBV9779105.1 HAD hydrolase-like protein [Acidobacteriaceae bacterium]
MSSSRFGELLVIAQSPPPDVIVFDMDGVLVEVTGSYREATRETVRHFTGDLVSHDVIQDFKNLGGWNNDWLLSHRLIQDRGKNVAYSDVAGYFNRVFFGENGDGLIRYEKWMPASGLLERLAERVSLAIFTGRAKYEADATLGRYAPGINFHPLITDELVANPKPAPDGLELIMHEHANKTLWYLGDTVDDARSAQAAGVPFVGISMPHNPRHAEIAALLKDSGAFAVLEDINQIEGLLQG